MRHRLAVAARISCLLVAGLLFAAAAPDDLGPPVGKPIPSFGGLQDQSRSAKTFADLTGEKGLVLLFYRSARWCPFCQAQLLDLNKNVMAIETRGYRLAAISYDDPEALATFAAAHQIKYPLLSDPGSKIIDLYGLRDPQYTSGIAVGVPRPIILVTDAEGVLKAKLFEETYKTRPQVSAILAVLDGKS